MSIEAATAASGENENRLTKENLALVDAASATEDRKKSSNEDDKSSVLSKIDSKHSGDLDLSEYCVSSDAETEKMDEESVSQRNSEHPVLSELAGASAPGDAGAAESGETNGAAAGNAAVESTPKAPEQHSPREEAAAPAVEEPTVSAVNEGVAAAAAAAAVDPPNEPEKAIMTAAPAEQPVDITGSGSLGEPPAAGGPSTEVAVSEPTITEPAAEPVAEPAAIEEQAAVPEQILQEAVPPVESPVVDPLKPSSPVPPSEEPLGPSSVVGPAEVASKQSGPVEPVEDTLGLAQGDAAPTKRAHEDEEDHGAHFKKPGRRRTS